MIIDKDILRWVLLIGATPIWYPFVRALWRDFNQALREDGGLMGSAPGPLELERMRREQDPYSDPLKSEPRVQPGQRRATRMRTPSANTPSAKTTQRNSSRPQPGSGPRAAPKRPGFKSGR
jgi:hypothetical protein